MAISSRSATYPVCTISDVMRGIMKRILASGNVLCHDTQGRMVLAAAVEPWLFGALAEFGSDLEDFGSGLMGTGAPIFAAIAAGGLVGYRMFWAAGCLS